MSELEKQIKKQIIEDANIDQYKIIGDDLLQKDAHELLNVVCHFTPDAEYLEYYTAKRMCDDLDKAVEYVHQQLQILAGKAKDHLLALPTN